MDFQNMTIGELKTDLIQDAKKGYPFLIAGTLYWLVMGGLSFFIDHQKQLALYMLIGTGSIFPLAIAIGQMLKLHLLSKNPLGVLSGIIGGIQAFYIPVWLILYIEHHQLIPMAIGILGGSHFLPYLWIYKSKAYGVFTVLMVVISFIFGYLFIDKAFSLLPFLLAGLYMLTAVALIIESNTFIASEKSTSISK